MMLDLQISDHGLSCSASTEVAGLVGAKGGCGRMSPIHAYSLASTPMRYCDLRAAAADVFEMQLGRLGDQQRCISAAICQDGIVDGRSFKQMHGPASLLSTQHAESTSACLNLSDKTRQIDLKSCCDSTVCVESMTASQACHLH